MSRRRVRSIMQLVALAALLSGVVPAASAATPEVESLTMIGTGTLAPGYPLTGCVVQTNFTFSSQVVIDAGDDALDADGDVPYSAYYNGNSGSSCETLASGQGNAALTIVDDDGHSWTTFVTYQRTLTQFELNGQVAINGVVHDILAAMCEFSYTSINPATTYQIECEVTLDR